MLADFCRSTPDRWLNVTPASERAKRVACSALVHGLEPARGGRAAQRCIDPLPDGTVHVAPEVAGTTVVEVWVERFDPAWGEDFGWQRRGRRAGHEAHAGRSVGGQRRAADAGHTAGAPGSDDGCGSRTAQVQSLSSQVLERSSCGRPLGRRRYACRAARQIALSLVMAEYEEYLVDDDQAYDQVPTKKERRMVFVEHIELA